MVCLYHLDDDGKCAAALVNKQVHDENKKFFEMNYGYDVPFDQIKKEELVYIVDLSIEPDQMIELLKITSQLVWIDHHITAIQKYENFPHSISGIRRTEYSGCMLTYMYLTTQLDLVDRDNLYQQANIPPIIRLCDDYDMWRFNLNITKDFHEGFSVIPHGPQDVIWDTLFDSSIQSLQPIVDSGRSIRNYRASMMKDLIESYGFESTLEGHPCFVLNQGIISSDDFATLDPDAYNFLIGIVYNGERWSYSLRSTPSGPNVAEIAKKYGGGGHVHAAGFNFEALLVKKENR